MTEYSHWNSKENGGYCNGEGLVDYGKRKRVGAGHRRGGAGRRGQRGSRSASHGRTGTSGGAIRRAGEARHAGSARGGRGKSSGAVGGGHLRAVGRSGQQCRLWAVCAV